MNLLPLSGPEPVPGIASLAIFADAPPFALPVAGGSPPPVTTPLLEAGKQVWSNLALAQVGTIHSEPPAPNADSSKPVEPKLGPMATPSPQIEEPADVRAHAAVQAARSTGGKRVHLAEATSDDTAPQIAPAPTQTTAKHAAAALPGLPTGARGGGADKGFVDPRAEPSAAEEQPPHSDNTAPMLNLLATVVPEPVAQRLAPAEVEGAAPARAPHSPASSEPGTKSDSIDAPQATAAPIPPLATAAPPPPPSQSAALHRVSPAKHEADRALDTAQQPLPFGESEKGASLTTEEVMATATQPSVEPTSGPPLPLPVAPPALPLAFGTVSAVTTPVQTASSAAPTGSASTEPPTVQPAGAKSQAEGQAPGLDRHDRLPSPAPRAVERRSGQASERVAEPPVPPAVEDAPLAATGNKAPTPIASSPDPVAAPQQQAASPIPSAPLALQQPVWREPEAALAPADARLHFASPRFAEEVGIAIARRPGGLTPGDELVLQIEPANMGRIRVELRFAPGGALEAVVSADQGRVLDQLRSHSAELHRGLVEAGGRADIAPPRFEARGDSGPSLLSQGGQGSSYQSAGSGGQSGHGHGHAQHGPRGSLHYQADPAPVASAQRTRSTVAPGRLDLIA